MASFDRLIAHNKRLSILLLIGLFLLLGAIGAAIGEYAGGSWSGGVLSAVTVATVYFLISWYAGGSMIMAVSGAREISREEAPQLWNVVDEMSIAAGIPMPKVYIIEESAMNAFATGRDPKHASVAITRGLLDRLNREELQGVMAHEMSHVRNYDIRFSMLMAVMVGSIVLICDLLRRSLFYGSARRGRGSRKSSQGQAIAGIIVLLLSILAPLFAAIIQLAVSRQREYLADASAVELTRNPAGLVSALSKLSEDMQELKGASRGTQHLFIVNPELRRRFGGDSLFSTHPSLFSRIERIEGLLVSGS